MSQSRNSNNYPSFNFNYYDAESSQSTGDAPFAQWSQQSSNLGNVVRGASPAPTFRSAGSTISPRQVPPMMNFNPGPMSQSDRIDPNLNGSLLTVPPALSRPRSAVDARPVLDTVGNVNLWFNQEAPWSSLRMRNTNVPVGRASFPQANLDYGVYRDAPVSEMESITPRSDSGYYTHHPQSIISNEQERCDQDLPQDVIPQMSNITVASAPMEPTDTFPISSADQVSQYSGRSHGKEFRCPEPDCREVSKCKSDHKKHMLKHQKPFKCEYPNCRRNGRGFTTVNDLNRHKKSVHRIDALKNSYQCASATCRNKEKIWPRLDNFKQHISRMHQDEDEVDLIRKSAYRPPEPTAATEPLSVAPMDTTLAGISTEKQYPSNDSDDPTSGISLTPDQGSIPWTISDLGPPPQSFAMDVDQANPRARSHVSASSGHDSAAATRDLGMATGNVGRSNSFRLDTLAALAASSQASSTDKPAPSHRQLSTAPQTKADQQKLALHKFSKLLVHDIQNSSDDESIDIESIVMRVLSGVSRVADAESGGSSASTRKKTKGKDAGTLTKSELLKASQAISKMIKESSTKRRIGIDELPQALPPNCKKCDVCHVVLARSCDLRKHMKRHTKPYGCTYPKCHKRFGAKSDWKRHENSQHFQLECFRCSLPRSSSSSSTTTTPPCCGDLFYRAEAFKAHLITEHKLPSSSPSSPDSPLLTAELKKRRIGKNGQGQFWCGFCAAIVRLAKHRNEAWDERFDHIDAHFRARQKIEDWFCVEAKRTKGEVRQEIDRAAFDDDDDEEEEEEEEGEASPGSSAQGRGREEELEDDDDEEAEEEDSESSTGGMGAIIALPPSSAKRKPDPQDRSAEALIPPVKRRKRELHRFCCDCQSGPFAYELFVSCLHCNHQLCGKCPVNG